MSNGRHARDVTLIQHLRSMVVDWPWSAKLNQIQTQIIAQAIQDGLEARRRFILFIPVCFGFGAGIYFLSPPPSLLFLLVGIGIALSLFLFLKLKPIAKLGLIGFSLILAGLGYSDYRLTERTVLLENKTYINGVIATVLKIERMAIKPDRLWVRIDPSQASAFKTNFSKPITLRLKGKIDESTKIKDQLLIDAMLFPPAPSVWPDGFSFRRYAYIHKISATGYLTASSMVSIQENSNSSLTDHYQSRFEAFKLQVDTVRAFISNRLRQSLSQPEFTPSVGSVAAALTVADRSGLGQELIATMQAAGLSHLFAISGLHLGLAAMIAFQLIRWSLALIERPALYHDSKKPAAIIAIICMFCYLWLAGATPPTQRAFMMGGLVLLAMLFDRQTLSLRPLAFAAMVILLFDPAYMVQAGFQLSFAAVTALVAVFALRRQRKIAQIISGDSDEHYWRSNHKFIWKLVDHLGLILLTSLVATLATTPLIAWHFGQFSWVALIANLCAVPLTAMVIMPALMLSLILMPLGLDSLFILTAGYAIELLLWLANWAATLPLAGEMIKPPSYSFLIGFVLLSLGAIILAGIWRWLLGVPALFLLGLAFLLSPATPDLLISGERRLIAIRDSGQLWLNDINKQKFVQQVWQQRSGLEIGGQWEDFSNQRMLQCDDIACIYNKNGVTIAILDLDYMKPLEEVQRQDLVKGFCRASDLVILPLWLESLPCQRQKLITLYDLKTRGWHHIYLDNQEEVKFQIQTARSIETDHPWRFYRKPLLK